MSAARRVVVGVGELLWDCFADSRRPGGAPANVAFHASQLGLAGVVCARVGCDDLGAELLQHLGDHGLDTDFIQRDEHHPTGTVTVHAERVDQPEYVIHEDVAWDHLDCDEQWTGLFKRADAVCYGTLAQRSPAGRRAVMNALDAASGGLKVCDVNLRPPWYSRAIVAQSLRRADVVKLSASELDVVCGFLDVGGN